MTTGCGFALHGVGVELGGRPVLTDIDLEVGPGESLALVGPSGAGKTTLLRLLNGGVEPCAGRVLVDGADLATLTGGELRRLRSQVGFVHQDLRLVPNLRVSQNVLSGSLGRRSLLGTWKLFLRPGRDDLLEVHALLEQVGIPEKMYERVDRLSGGQAQRVAVARALFQRPDMLLADEPVASVDPGRARAVLHLLTELARERGLTLAVSLHDPLLVREFFPRVVGLSDGRIVFDRPVEAVTAADLEDLYAGRLHYED